MDAITERTLAKLQSLIADDTSKICDLTAQNEQFYSDVQRLSGELDTARKKIIALNAEIGKLVNRVDYDAKTIKRLSDERSRYRDLARDSQNREAELQQLVTQLRRDLQRSGAALRNPLIVGPIYLDYLKRDAVQHPFVQHPDFMKAICIDCQKREDDFVHGTMNIAPECGP